MQQGQLVCELFVGLAGAVIGSKQARNDAAHVSQIAACHAVTSGVSVGRTPHCGAALNFTSPGEPPGAATRTSPTIRVSVFVVRWWVSIDTESRVYSLRSSKKPSLPKFSLEIGKQVREKRQRHLVTKPNLR